MTITEDELLDRLGSIEDPQNDDDIVSMGLVNDITIEDGTANISLAFNTPYAPTEIDIGGEIREVVEDAGLDFSLSANVGEEHGFDDEVLPTVRNVIAVASGKGGVGKTTVAANLAAGLKDRGARVGLLDADIHGPNIPRVLEVEGEPGVLPNDDIVPPRTTNGVSVMSMDHLTDGADDPAVMRGPMVNNVMMKFVNEVSWGQLDYLIVDLPPGTGDASLTLLQNLPIRGVIIVTTPQEMSVLDARKGLNLFNKHDTPVLGLVENMSMFDCPDNDKEYRIFGEGGADEIREDYGVPILKRLPIHPDFDSERIEGPVVTAEESEPQEAVVEMVENTADRIGELNRKKVANGGELTLEEQQPKSAQD